VNFGGHSEDIYRISFKDVCDNDSLGILWSFATPYKISSAGKKEARQLSESLYGQSAISVQEKMDVIDVVVIMANGFWLFIPAMLPNSAAAMVGGGTKIDFGKTWRGKRIFGDGKTWRGLFGGGLAGVAIGLVLIGISSIWDPVNYWGFGPFWGNVGILFCLAFGAIVGDLIGAFIKRRLGMERGQKAPILDQYDFVFGAFLITSIFFPSWVYSMFIEGWHIAALLFILALMFFIHRIVNILGYKLGFKKEPW
jgi:CDP-2,3-bis-(O-geranylgeranyl)-sn-glycerol synthase